ncbi:aminotransferase class IV [Thermocrinis sp.]|uniref:aminotransferase class IV n=1 Tax=Thermocrinis sp. TaxID=2024383 RepID=UPI002FDD33BC
MINRTLLYGEGLFETMKLPISEKRLRLHYERLKGSAEFFGIPCPSYEEFKEDCMVEVKDQSYLKFCLIAKGEDYYGGKANDYGKMIILKKLKPIQGTIKLTLSSYRRHSTEPICRHKTTNYLFNVMVKRQALQEGFYDGIIVNERDEVCETSSANLLFLKGNTLYTPAKESGILEGTTLRILKEFMDVKEERIKVERLKDFEGAFIVNALIDCLPVEIEGFGLRILKGVSLEIKKVIERFEFDV